MNIGRLLQEVVMLLPIYFIHRKADKVSDSYTRSRGEKSSAPSTREEEGSTNSVELVVPEVELAHLFFAP